MVCPVIDDRNFQTLNEYGLGHKRNAKGASADESGPYFRFANPGKKVIVDHEMVPDFCSIHVF
jgi:hypothetical protein